MQGFSMGLAAGLAGGYLVARDNGFDSRDWRPLAAGAGIGALAGGFLGFTLGIVDNSSTPTGRESLPPGRSYLVMHGMSEGGGFGMIAGAIIGGLAALKTDKPEHILFGAAIGTLSGTVVGLMYGALQPNPWAPRTRRMAWNLGVQPVPTVQSGWTLLPVISGRY